MCFSLTRKSQHSASSSVSSTVNSSASARSPDGDSVAPAAAPALVEVSDPCDRYDSENAPPRWAYARGSFSLRVSQKFRTVVQLPRGIELSFGPSLLAVLAAIWFLGVQLWEVRDIFAGSNLAPLLGLTALPSSGFENSSVSFGFVVAVLFLCSMFAHEIGHGLGFLATGRRWDSLSFEEGRPRARSSSRAANSHQQLIASGLGGGLQLTVGLLSLLAAGGPGWSAFAIVAIWATFEGLFSLLIPVDQDSDARAFWHHAGRVLKGRGREFLDSARVEKY